MKQPKKHRKAKTKTKTKRRPVAEVTEHGGGGTAGSIPWATPLFAPTGASEYVPIPVKRPKPLSAFWSWVVFGFVAVAAVGTLWFMLH